MFWPHVINRKKEFSCIRKFLLPAALFALEEEDEEENIRGEGVTLQ